MYISRVCENTGCDSDLFTLFINDRKVIPVCNKCQMEWGKIELPKGYSIKIKCDVCNNLIVKLKQDNKSGKCIFLCRICNNSLETFRVNTKGEPLTIEDMVEELYKKMGELEKSLQCIERKLRSLEESKYYSDKYVECEIDSVKKKISSLG